MKHQTDLFIMQNEKNSYIFSELWNIIINYPTSLWRLKK